MPKTDDDLYDIYADAYEVALKRSDEDEHAWPKRAVYLAGYDDAASVVRDRFFGGPTKDMILAWLDEARSNDGPADV